jgi:hypothetical protein
VQSFVGVEHWSQSDQVLLVAPAPVVEHEQALRLGAGRALDEA